MAEVSLGRFLIATLKNLRFPWTRLKYEEDQPFNRRRAEVPLSLIVLEARG